MLRRAENVSVSYQPSVFGKGWLSLTVGRQTHRIAKMPRSEADLQREASADWPVRYARVGERTYYRFKDKWFWDNDDLTADQVHALLVTRQHRETARIERAQAMVAIDERPVPVRRGAIPQDVQQLVYLRDEGRCQHCGSTTEIQFDHMIPLAMGGSSEDLNLQLLCDPATGARAPASRSDSCPPRQA